MSRVTHSKAKSSGLEYDSPSTPQEPAPLTQGEHREFLCRASQFVVTTPAAMSPLDGANKPAKVDSDAPVTTSISGPGDWRLKADIVREGTLPNGIALYSCRYTGGRQRFGGMMADEVEAVMPSAVSTHRSCYKMVNDAMVLG
ncbi:MAG: hypothetical protein AB7O80_27580 [Acetobacteraceae bacterium]